jgi:pectinesterase
MKTLIVGLVAFFLALPLAAQQCFVTVTNPAPFDRALETIEVSWQDVQAALSLSPQDRVGVIRGQETLVSQTIDYDGDGVADVLIFQSSFRAKEQQRFVVKRVSNMPKVDSITDAKFVVPRKDVAWENDRIAYRIYGGPLAGDVRDGIDVWVKRVRYHVIDKWYHGDSFRGAQRISYHVDHGEGADFFLVGRSLGGGGCALWKDSALHQAGFFTSHRIIATGPIRAMFRVAYESDSASTLSFKAEKTYTLDAGMNLNKIDVQYSGIVDSEAEIAIGLVRRKNTVRYANGNEGWLSLWGSVDDDSANGSLGIGIVVQRNSLRRMEEDSTHYLIIASSSPGKRLAYYAGAGWTQSGDFPSVEDWNNYLSRFAQGLQYPIQVRVSSAK